MATSKEKWSGWVSRIEERTRVFESGWWKQAKAAQEMYDRPGLEGSAANPFNILYANTEVLLPAMYSATPKPDIRLRFKGGMKPVATAVERLLTVLVDNNSPGVESFDEAMLKATLNALVPGAGAVRLRVDPEAPCPIMYEGVSFDDIIWGYAKKWSRVPWLAFRHKMTLEGIISRFKLTPAQEKKLSVPTQEDEDGRAEHKGSDSPVYVYELWIKSTKDVVFLCEGYEDVLLEDVGDVMKLQGFYPLPGLLMMVEKTGELCPTPLYEYYRNQAEELNRVTVRLNRVLGALRVRGVYNSLIGSDLGTLLADGATDNALLPSQNPMDLMGKGFDGNIWLLPIEKMVVVARELYSARQAIKQVIYEITGLADIVRGASVASETATAQNLKNKWGTVRLKRMQTTIARYVRDLFRLTADAGNLLAPEQWKALTKLPFPSQEQKAAAMMQMQQMAMAQVPGQPPQQPPQELVAVLQQPAWEEVIQLLADDRGRTYLIDVETDSTVDDSAVTDKDEVTEFMTALGALLSGLTPLTTLGPQGLEVAKEILMAVAGKYKFGQELEETLAKLNVSQPPPKDPAADAKAQAEQAKAQAFQQKIAGELELMKAEIQAAREEQRMAQERHAMELRFMQEKHMLEMQGMKDKAMMQAQTQMLNARMRPKGKPSNQA